MPPGTTADRRKRPVQAASTAQDVWADSAYGSAENESPLAANRLTSQVHRQKLHGRPMPKGAPRPTSAVRAKVKHIVT
ncbi:hypothetical protein JANAI62_09260 [Jannaschia pagri]|uniref:Transposase n=1 Tax=Jannaschia pagri TaxID=2829797 RepID=A0ABQ4NIR5_9RHOB|nr:MULTISPECIES: hypothetical protein [unclassified Jannaschia]GIT89589.1 hypothetical protein JANAI61_00470 [Jannaschia sp. AI_61]GIT94303.1 hypothetical protein JANAI62_09260 [Jannaschia sp. AI_62]